jgi:predicted ester cyclase
MDIHNNKKTILDNWNLMNQFLAGEFGLDEAITYIDKFWHSEFQLILPHRDPMTYTGKDALKLLLLENKNSFQGLKFLIKDMISEQDKLWCFGQTKGIHSSMYLGIPATYNKVSFDFVYMYRFKDGKIIEGRVISDTLALFLQLGKAVIQNSEQEDIEKYLDSLKKMSLLPK